MLVTGLVDSCQKCKINCGDEVEPTPTSNTLSHSGTARFHQSKTKTKYKTQSNQKINNQQVKNKNRLTRTK
jgi:hypothetical protein